PMCGWCRATRKSRTSCDRAAGRLIYCDLVHISNTPYRHGLVRRPPVLFSVFAFYLLPRGRAATVLVHRCHHLDTIYSASALHNRCSPVKGCPAGGLASRRCPGFFAS